MRTSKTISSIRDHQFHHESKPSSDSPNSTSSVKSFYADFFAK